MQPPPPKKEVALALLERSSVHLHLDPRSDGAVVPPWFKKQPQLVLQVGLNMPVPIEDLRLDEEGLSCTLSFNRSPFFCVVPWKSVFAIVGDDGRGMVWPDDVPPEVAQQSARASSAREPAASARPEPALRAAPSPEAGTPSSKGKRPRKKPQLVAAPEPRRDGEPASSPPPRLAPAHAQAPAPSEPQSPRAASRGNAPSPFRQRPQEPAPHGGAAKKPKRELPPYLRVVK